MNCLSVCQSNQKRCRGPSTKKVLTDPLEFQDLPAALGYSELQGLIFWLALRMSLIISLEWLISNQGSQCLVVSVVCAAAKWMGCLFLSGSRVENDSEGRMEALSQKNPEKCSSK